MKHYFFLSQADFLMEFLDNSLPFLRLPASQLSVLKLQSILDLAIKTSSVLSSTGVHKGFIPKQKDADETVKVQLSKYAFVDMLVKIMTGADSSISLSELEINTESSSSATARMTGNFARIQF